MYTELIRDIPDFPKPGILFKDITPLLADRKAFEAACEDMAAPFRNDRIDMVVGIESRGFIFGPTIAGLLDVGFAPIRKPGKLPFQTESVSYDLEYGSDQIEIHIDALAKGARVLIVDDLMATGGTAEAACKLVEKLGAIVGGLSFLIELKFLNGRVKFEGHKVHAPVVY